MTDTVETGQANTETATAEESALTPTQAALRASQETKGKDEGKPEDKAKPETEAKETTEPGSEDEAATSEEESGETGVPEKYEWQVPEGFEGQLDKSALEQFEPMAKELGLSQEQANKLVKIHADTLQAAQQQQSEQWSQTLEQWRNDLQKDPEFGGAKFDENVQSAQKAIEQFGTPELREALNESGYGNHPELVKVFAKIGKAISEDKVITGGKTNGPRSTTEILYPDMAKRR